MSRAQIQGTIFGLADYEAWVDRLTRSQLGIPGPAFEQAFMAGRYRELPFAHDVASVFPLMRALRARPAPAHTGERP